MPGAAAGAARIDVRRAIGATGDADFAPSVQGRGLASRRYYGSTLEYPALRQCSHAPARCCSAHSACSCCALAPRWAISSSASTPPARARAPVRACVRACVRVRACVHVSLCQFVCARTMSRASVRAHVSAARALLRARVPAAMIGPCALADVSTNRASSAAPRACAHPRAQSRRRCGHGVSSVPVQMWAWGEFGPGADVAWDKPSLSRRRCGHGVSPGPAVGAGVRRRAILP
jgi:hypothetical protein